MSTFNLGDTDAGQKMAIREQLKALIHDIKGTVGRLNEIWDRVHLEEELREERVHHAFRHFHNTLKELVITEEEMAIEVEKNIVARRYMVQQMRERSNMPDFDESPYPSGSTALLKALDRDLATLAEQKNKAMKTQLQLYRGIAHLRMPAFDDVNEMIYDDRRLNKMRALIPELCTTMERRVEKITALQEESRKIYEALVPNASITNEEVALLQTDFSDGQTIVSAQFLQLSETLNQKLKDEYDTWLEKVANRYEELQAKMEELSKKCNAIPSFRQQLNYDQATAVVNERDLQRLEDDSQRMDERYERGRPVFDKLNAWMGLWREKLDTEKRVCQMSFYKNCGGSVNSQLKRQKQVDMQLPKTLNELRVMVEEYGKLYGHEDILVEGVRPDEYAANVMRAYESEEEVQKVQKRFAKQHKYNPSVASPSRQGTPFRTPHIALAVPPSYRPTVKRKRSVSITGLSEIQPVGGPIDGPRTSSRKPSPPKLSKPVPQSAKTPVKRAPFSSTSKLPSAMKTAPFYRGVACFNCGQEGHLSRHCPEPRRGGGGGGGGACFNCGQEGHISRDCSEPRRGGGGGRGFGGTCYNCGEAGHISRHCPNARR